MNGKGLVGDSSTDPLAIRTISADEVSVPPQKLKTPIRSAEERMKTKLLCAAAKTQIMAAMRAVLLGFLGNRNRVRSHLVYLHYVTPHQLRFGTMRKTTSGYCPVVDHRPE